MTERLLDWFDRHHRPLPWREDRDPYRIWVSEVMLQQTTVAAVAEPFRRFIEAFPDVRALASADEQHVLRLWEGLGYYSRARNLHTAARRLVAEHDGLLPDDPEVWAGLPGVGRYILGAVLSQAFDRRLPVLEANTKRVLCRLSGERGDPKTTETSKRLWALAEAILPPQRAGDFNQALMELGALVCKPRSPDCENCPLAETCVANRDGSQADIPVRSPKRATVEVSEVGVVLRDRDRVLLVRRPSSGRWANMWEFPHAELADGEIHDVTGGAVRLVAEIGFTAEIGDEVTTIRHAVTHHRIRMVVLEAESTGGGFVPGRYAEARWVAPGELGGFPVSSPQRKLAGAVADPARARRLF